MRDLLGLRMISLKVHPDRILQCLGWLREHNPLYRDVVTDEEALQSLRDAYQDAVGMNLEQALAEFDNFEERVSSMMGVDPVPVQEKPAALAENIGAVVIERTGQACRPHEVPDLLARAFPSLFPTGTNSDYRSYTVPLTASEMLEHTVRFADPRFSRHYRYVFMMVNVKNLDSAYKSIGAALTGRVLRARIGG